MASPVNCKVLQSRSERIFCASSADRQDADSSVDRQANPSHLGYITDVEPETCSAVGTLGLRLMKNLSLRDESASA